MAYEYVPGVGWADVVDYGTPEAAEAALGEYQNNFIQQVINPAGQLENVNLSVDFSYTEPVYDQVQPQLAGLVAGGNTIVTEINQLPVFTPSVVPQVFTPHVEPQTLNYVPPVAGVSIGLFDDTLPKIGGAIGDIALMPVIVLMAMGNKRAGDFLPLVLLLSMLNDNVGEPFNTPQSGGVFNKGVADGWY